MAEINLQTHLSEDALELYSLERLPEAELDGFEQHLLACAACQDRLAETDRYINAVKQASVRLDQELAIQKEDVKSSSWLSGWTKPMWAAGVAVAAAAIMMPLFGPALMNSPSPVSVQLYATRSAEAATVQAGAPLDLTIDTSGVEAGAKATVEVVNLQGAQIWQGTLRQANNRAFVSLPDGLAAGSYWVRLYSDGNRTDPIREFSLLVK
jgi:anti-sigma factor RsiW